MMEISAGRNHAGGLFPIASQRVARRSREVECPLPVPHVRLTMPFLGPTGSWSLGRRPAWLFFFFAEEIAPKAPEPLASLSVGLLNPKLPAHDLGRK